ncbi:MAG TPA: hypothetical protein VF618_29020 [Thermoanaerobaculia bacterium]
MRALLLLFALLSATPAAAHPAVSIVVDSQGNLYYSDLEQVFRVTPRGVRSVAVPKVHTHELHIDADDNLFGEDSDYEGGDRYSHAVWRRSSSGRIFTVIPRRPGFSMTDYSFVRDDAGNMYIAVGKEIHRRTPAGRTTVLARGLTEIRRMHALRDGTLFVHDVPAIKRISREGVVTTVLPNVGNDRHDVMGLFSDPAGNPLLCGLHEPRGKAAGRRGKRDRGGAIHRAMGTDRRRGDAERAVVGAGSGRRAASGETGAVMGTGRR